MKVVAFSGNKGSGKDTAAQVLVNEGYKLLHFADPLKQVCSIAYGLTDQELNDPTLKEIPLGRWPYKTPREIMQQVGTELFRRYLPETWTRAFEREAYKYEKVVCPDLRFLDEATLLKRMGASLILIQRPTIKADDASFQHRSETELVQINFDHVIVNDGSIESLHAKVRDILCLPANFSEAV